MQIRHDDLSSNLQENEHTLVEKIKCGLRRMQIRHDDLSSLISRKMPTLSHTEDH
jgi:hypothetical protein